MHKQQNSMRLFRLLATFAVIALIFSQFVSTAQAQEPLPPTKEPLPQVDLDELEGYYGRLANRQGPLGIVVELKDTPSALIYAEALQQPDSATLSVERTQQQTIKIQQAQATFTRALGGLDVQANELYRTQKVYNGIWMRVQPEDVAKIASIRGVKAIHPMIPKTIEHTTSVPLLGAPQVWGGLGGYLGEGISVGVIDTGIDYVHTNFDGGGVYTGQDYTIDTELGGIFPSTKVVGGYDFAGDAYDADPSSATYNPIPSPDPDPMDCNGHGSHVSGSVGGYGVLADGSTYVESGADTYANLSALSAANYIAKFRIGPGMAPKVSLYGLRVFGCEGSTDLTTQAIEWAMDPNGDSNLSDHLDVINMSLGSSYGSEYDDSAIASNNAALAGVIVVTSAGNSGDSYYVTGAPGVARYAISAANSVDAGAVLDAFEVTANSAPSPVVPLGLYPASDSVGSFGPSTYDLTGELLKFSDTDLGCSAYPAGTFTGKIALINRGTCAFTIKVKNAQNAGATGVLLANNVDTFPGGMGGADATITIPAMMTTKTIGTNLRTDMAVGAVSVRLTTAYLNTLVMTDYTVQDTLSASSSRGPARAGTLLKPDLTAPGETIFSTATGSGNQGASFTGTSMASPHVAGMMALLREQHPGWSVAELKALAMNTATNEIWTSAAHTLMHTPTRIGAGRVSVAKAVQSDVVAYYADDPGQVSVAFGDMALTGSQTFTKSITLDNKNAAAADYNVTFDSRYPANPGLTFALLDAFNVALASPVTVPGSGTLEIKVQVSVNPALLTKTIDATVSTASGRERFSEGGGYVTLTSTGSAQTLRVPVHIAARPASTMSVAETSLILPAAATGTVSLTPVGSPVAVTGDASKVYITELLYSSPDEASVPDSTDSADLKYVGAISDYPASPFASASMYFSIATHGNWDTLHTPEFDIYIDIDEDGTDDAVLYNYHTGTSSSPTDTMYSVICTLQPTVSCGFADFINWFGGSTNTNTYNNNVMTMDVYLADLGLVEGVNTSFNFYIVTFHRDAAGVVDISPTLRYDVGRQSFDTSSASFYGFPAWRDNPSLSPTFDIGYNKANIAIWQSKGLLFLHTHNAAGNTAQTLLLPSAHAFTKYNPANGATGVSTSPFLSWQASSAATSYEYCIDTINNDSCDTGWVDRGTNTSIGLSGLAANATYYWQVRAMSIDGTVVANDGAWWSFTTNACYTLTKSGNPSGSVSASPAPNCTGGMYLSGTVVQLTPVPASGYVFLNWSGDLSGSANPASLTMDADKSVTANFNAPPGSFPKYAPANGASNMTINPVLSWQTSAGATSYEYCIDTSNDTVCDTGWISRGSLRSVGLSGLLGGTTYYWQAHAVNGDGTVEANSGTWWSFTTLACYTLTTNGSPSGSVFASPATNCPGGKYTAGTVVQLSPRPAYGYTFSTWSGDLTGSANPGSVTMDADKSVTANYIAPPTPFSKYNVSNGATGVSINPLLNWGTSINATSYEYCIDTSNDTVCDTGWVSRGAFKSVGLSGLLPTTTYYWQARAVNGIATVNANGGTWWSFTTGP